MKYLKVEKISVLVIAGIVIGGILGANVALERQEPQPVDARPIILHQATPTVVTTFKGYIGLQNTSNPQGGTYNPQEAL